MKHNVRTLAKRKPSPSSETATGRVDFILNKYYRFVVSIPVEPFRHPLLHEIYVYHLVVKCGYCPPFLSFRMLPGITRKGEPKDCAQPVAPRIKDKDPLNVAQAGCETE